MPVVIESSDRWKAAYPGAAVGLLVMRGAANPARSEALDQAAERIEASLRGRFGPAGRAAILADPAVAAYTAYYRRFNKTYHVALQVESVAVKGKPILSAGALVKAMFVAEVSSLLLTAGHDLSRISPPLRVDTGDGSETYMGLGGSPRAVKESDMRISDCDGVISSIIGGPDQRTCITTETRNVLFAVYAPPGVDVTAVRAHLEEIDRLVRVVSPAAARESLEIVQAS